MILTRRRFIAGLGSFIAGPAIVRASSLMPIAAVEDSWRQWHQVARMLDWRLDHIINPPLVMDEMARVMMPMLRANLRPLIPDLAIPVRSLLNRSP